MELVSPLPPAECAARLVAAIDTGFSGLFGFRPVRGRVSERAFRLWKRIE
jgi:hypothetical protein